MVKLVDDDTYPEAELDISCDFGGDSNEKTNF